MNEYKKLQRRWKRAYKKSQKQPRTSWKSASNPKVRLLTSSQPPRGYQKKSKAWSFPFIMILLAGYAYWYNGRFITENRSVSIEESSSNKTIIYNSIYSQLAEHRTVITLINPTFTDNDILKEQFHLVINDHPELFWLSGGGQGHIVTTGAMKTYTFRPSIIDSIENVPTMEQQLNIVVDQLVEAANQKDTDYEKALLIHDAIINLCEYDMETFYNDPDKATLSHTAYGCLVQHYAVCAGYAKAFQLIMNRIGIECGYISGTATDSVGFTGPHAWNYINLDGQYYYVDVTWDDPVVINGPSTLRHDYFCLSAEEMGKNHYADVDQEMPKTTT